MARKHMRMAHVVVLVLDAAEGLVGLDATVAGYAHEEGRALILCVNKWDTAPDPSQRAFTARIRYEFKFLDYAPIAFVSALTGAGVGRLFPMIRETFEAASKRIGTGELNRFVETLDFAPQFKVKYVTQASIRPPTFVLFTDKARSLHFSTERFIANRLRERYGFQGTPIVVKARRK
jgi:GTP-binding protein